MKRTFLARVTVRLKPSVNDPQGLAIRGGLQTLGFAGVRQVRAGKHLEVALEEEDLDAATDQVDAMCARLLANPVIEEYSFEVEETAQG